jgi:hypothetical protein
MAYKVLKTLFPLDIVKNCIVPYLEISEEEERKEVRKEYNKVMNTINEFRFIIESMWIEFIEIDYSLRPSSKLKLIYHLRDIKVTEKVYKLALFKIYDLQKKIFMQGKNNHRNICNNLRIIDLYVNTKYKRKKDNKKLKKLCTKKIKCNDECINIRLPLFQKEIIYDKLLKKIYKLFNSRI